MRGDKFYARHFSVSQFQDGGAYLLSVAALRLPPSEGGSHQFIFPRRRNGLVGRLVSWAQGFEPSTSPSSMMRSRELIAFSQEYVVACLHCLVAINSCNRLTDRHYTKYQYAALQQLQRKTSITPITVNIC